MPPALPPLRRQHLNRALLARQLLLSRAQIPLSEALPTVGVLQAQWAKPPFVAVWSRLASFHPADLTALAHSRTLVRGTLHRGTLHLATAEDFHSFRLALQPTLTRGLRSVVKTLSAKDEASILAAARTLLADGPRTFTSLRNHLVQLHPTLPERHVGHLVRMTLPLVQIPDNSTWGWPTDAAFGLAEPWIGRGPLAEPAVGLRHLVLRYLAAFGPASVRDVQSFTGVLGLAPTLASLKADLLVFRAEDGTELFDLADAPRPDPDVPAPPRLLAEYDSAILAHHDRTRIVPAEHRANVILPGLRIPATFLVDGYVAGTWSIPPGTKKKPTTSIALEPFGRLSKRTREALEAEGEALVAVLNRHASAS